MAQRTITSPGVEIRETDLSLIAPQNIGTNFYITGFAQQGPLDEVLKITTKQELDRIFGTPTNSAERYFYYSISEMLNSPGNVYASRLPYGESAGDGFGAKYSALVYPVRTVANPIGGSQTSSYDLTINYPGTAALAALKDASFSFKTGNGALSSVGFNIASAGIGGYATAPDIVAYISATATPTQVALAIQQQATLSAAAIAPNGITSFVASTNTLKINLSGASELGPSSSQFSSKASITSPYSNNVNNSFTFLPTSTQVVGTNLDVLSGTYVLGEPTHLELTQDDYFSALEGSGFTWSHTASAKDSFAGVSNLGGAGLVVLNKAQTTINSQFEGYYIGIADNTNINPDSNFDSILEVKTVNAAETTTTNYTTIPNGVYNLVYLQLLVVLVILYPR